MADPSSSHGPLPPTTATMLPPPTTAQSQHPRPSSSPGKRKRESNTTVAESEPASVTSNARTAFSDSTKSQIERIYRISGIPNGIRCWHCGASPIDFCHVVAQKDPDFDVLRTRGLLSLGNVNENENAVLLCPTCHRNFDTTVGPGLVFFPTDLDYFKDFEESDYERRKALVAKEQWVTRITPKPQDYLQVQIENGLVDESAKGGLYKRLVLRDFTPKRVSQFEPDPQPRTGEVWGPASWHGDPLAALRRTFQALSNLGTSLTIPRDIRESLQKLQNLYDNNDLELGNTAKQAVTAVSQHPSPGSDAGERGEHQTTGAVDEIWQQERNTRGQERGPTDRNEAPTERYKGGSAHRQKQGFNDREEGQAEQRGGLDLVCWLSLCNGTPSPDKLSDHDPVVSKAWSESPTLVDKTSIKPDLEYSLAKDPAIHRQSPFFKWGPRATASDVMKFHDSIRAIGKPAETSLV